MPLLETLGAASAKGFGFGAASGPVTYVNDVFNTYTWTGNGTYVPITTGIDLATKGGATLSRARNSAEGFSFIDTVRGYGQQLVTSGTTAQYFNDYLVHAFSTTGFTSLGDNFNYVTYTFRKQPKFFDIVTGTGPGTFSHSLGQVPGMIIFKPTNAVGTWYVVHNGLSGGINGGQAVSLNTTNASSHFGSMSATASTFATTFYAGASDTWIAYLFGHDTTSTGLVQCGTYTGNGSATGPVVTLGYEPQFVMAKASSATGNWVIEDTQRGMSQLSSNALYTNTTGVETAINPGIIPTATGFTLGTTTADLNASGVTYIYMAIRMPNKPPTSGSEVFEAVAYTGGTDQYAVTTTTVTSPDVFWAKWRAGNPGNLSHNIWDKLRGVTVRLFSNQDSAENTAPITSFNMKGVTLPIQYANTLDTTYVGWFFKRAPKFFDIVCYTSANTFDCVVSHNLGVKPELIITKQRDSAYEWSVAPIGIDLASIGNLTGLSLNLTAASRIVGNPTTAFTTSQYPATLIPSASSSSFAFSQSGGKYVAYLFATLPGVSKVGSYIGTGATQTINCGFTGGARFVMIKRTDSAGDWYVWDTTRGMVSGTDPFLLFNTNDGEVNTNNVYTATTGFQIVTNAIGINNSAGTYIFLAIA